MTNVTAQPRMIRWRLASGFSVTAFLSPATGPGEELRAGTGAPLRFGGVEGTGDGLDTDAGGTGRGLSGGFTSGAGREILSFR